MFVYSPITPNHAVATNLELVSWIYISSSNAGMYWFALANTWGDPVTTTKSTEADAKAALAKLASDPFMWILDIDGSAASNVHHITRFRVGLSGSNWVVYADPSGSTVAGPFTTEAAATTALTDLLDRFGWVPTA